jgi:hypothetical protein
MIVAALTRAFDRFRGAGAAAITLSPMDGALRPNAALDAADVALQADRPDSLGFDGRRVLVASGRNVLAFDPEAAVADVETVASFDQDVTCLAANPAGDVIVGLNDGRILFAAGAQQGRRIDAGGPRPSCPTALLFDGATLLVCHGSRRHPPLDWKRDLMERNASGSVWRIDLASGQGSCLADGLGFAYGLALAGDGSIAVSESWRHRVIAVRPDRGVAGAPLLDDLPGYPARLAPARGGGYWLSVFAPRSRLIEFVLRERAFCEDMFREVEPDFWIAPALSSGKSFLEPLQGGGIKQLGILKPWAPGRSYGLLIRLDAKFNPVASFHSRADGARHGVTDGLDLGERVLVAAKGGNVIVALQSGPVDKAARTEGVAT